ncbi:FtsK/SpoIIIE domain-containing protein [Butyrivibrio sp. NC2002]|uniref:FtsK/SpoIIIE domain-containing protein n=1 Tax=Butyrivibrio sp. NC2002 TaxID=1410610 RepID=UPI00055F0796|nr:FtsK/SpoIIIE domain-containing protein [Butyrivibrio sp. NC2002]
MSTILTIYSHNAFKRFLLPAINNSDYSILLSDRLFDIDTNIDLRLEVADDNWYFASTDDYVIEHVDSKEDCYENPIQDGTSSDQGAYKLLIDGKHIISIIARITDNYFSEYEMYSIKDLPTPIDIGREKSCMISYDFAGKNLLSTDHALIFKSGDKVLFRDNETANGSFINNSRVFEDTELKFGDCIDIFGLRIVFFGDKISINVIESGAVINESVLQKIVVEAPPIEKVNKQNLTTLFHRSPRRIAQIDTEPVKIDDPPEPRDEVKDRGILAAIGAAIGMALPMLIGCTFMLYASRVSGFNRGLFMYVGLVTALSSAIIGTIRSLTGMKNAKKEYEEYERLRNERYGAYLSEQREIIKEKYNKNTNAMHDRYYGAAYCCAMNEENPLLWSRNTKQPDFLNVRLGLGNIPFQVEIEIPDKKFTMIDNALVDIPGNIKKEFSTLKNVPVCIDLIKEKLIGVIGGRKAQGAAVVARDIIAQIAANNSYTDVKIVLIYDEKKTGLGRTWDFVRWLPHVWNETKSFRYVASNKEEASDVFYEINKLLRQRQENASFGSMNENAIPKPYYVMILANPELMEGELISKYILNPEPVYGMSTIILTERYEQLPNECEMIVQNDETYNGIYHISDDYEQRTEVEFDEVSTEDLDTLASNIANVEVQEIETGGDITDSITFFEMYGINKLDELHVLNRWKKCKTYETMRALVGQKSGGAPCYLDIHEKYHGPHGLVAGTTGSGKSETLQTYILSLAINFSPDDVGFFIIDYKGGGMANLFTDLPHMIGQISNLSGNQVNRALVSIQSEKDRRETLFRDYGVKDIRDYTKLYKNFEATVPLPHLIIVIDEFAEMKMEEPEFIQEIVSVSRVGRSLGIHLIMATQKPAGSVSEDIWSNSRFKLCLRVQSRQDSIDMLRKPDAAYLTRSGRAYLQVGNDELYEQFQSGFSGAVYYEDEGDSSLDTAKMLEVTGTSSIEGNHTRMARQREKKLKWIKLLVDVMMEICNEKGYELSTITKAQIDILIDKMFKKLADMNEDYPVSDRNRENLGTLIEIAQTTGPDAEKIIIKEAAIGSAKKKLPQQPERTQLEAVVAYLKDLAEKNGYNHDFSLFLPLLPKRITLRELPQRVFKWDEESVFNGTSWPKREELNIETSIGLYDDPENQRQDVFSINLSETGNILVFGASTTGKTTLLQTIIYGFVNRYSPAEINIYALEFSARKLSLFENMPNVGGVIRDSDDNDKIDKFFIMLHGILKDRKLLQQAQKRPGQITVEDLPRIVIFIDNFAALNNKTGDKYHSFIMQLVKEGVGNGIFLIVSATGTGSSEIPNSLAQNFKTTICLELNNTYDYGNYMRMTRLRVFPENGIKGRGIGYVDDRILEFQTAIAIDGDDVTVEENIEKLTMQMKAAWDGECAMPIPEIPKEPTWDIFEKNSKVKEMIASDRLLPLGYDATLAVPFGIDLSEIYSLLIVGAKKKGKTNALKIAMRSAKARGGRVIIVDFKNQFTAFAQEIDARRIATEQEWATFLTDLLVSDVAPRNKMKAQLIEKGAEEKEIYEHMKEYESIFIFVDDLPFFIDKMIHPAEDVPKNILLNMEMIADKGALHNIYWFVTINKEDIAPISSYPLYRMFTRDKKAIHFGGNVHTTTLSNLSFDNQDRRSLDMAKPVGRGMLSSDMESDVKEIIVPMIKGNKG